MQSNQMQSKTPIGMTRQQADDLRDLNEQIELTNAHLAGLREQRDILMRGKPNNPAEAIENDTMSDLAGEPFADNSNDPVESAISALDQLQATNDRLRDFVLDYERQQQQIDDDFDQRLKDDATQPQREFSDCF